MTNINRICLTGIMGSGKTTVGLALAQSLGWTFIDLDEAIEIQSGDSIPEIFQTQGEAEFRRLETLALRATTRIRNAVIALGGGALENEKNRILLNPLDNRVLWLNTDPAVAAERVYDDAHRPLIARYESVEEVEQFLRKQLKSREPNYSTADFILDLTDEQPDKIVQEILSKLPIDYVKTPDIAGSLSADSPYPVLVNEGGISQIGRVLERRGFSRRAALITDTNVEKLYHQQVKTSLENTGFHISTCTIPAGEKHKRLSTLRRLYDELSEAGLDRKSPVVVLGGGVTGDLGGYFAASYLRGMPLIHLPTSILAQVDSSIGGKVGVNLPAGKNLVGAFYNPEAVLADVNTLATLPPREWYTGIGEVYKYWLIGKTELIDILKDGIDNIKNNIKDVVRLSIEKKLEIVREDYRESGIRRYLNFGHTLGHALEKVTGYEVVNHGEAVYWGMLSALCISRELDLLNSKDFNKSMEMLESAGFSLPGFTIDSKEMYEALFFDKKRIRDQIHWVLLNGIGNPVIRKGVPKKLVMKAMQFSAEQCGTELV